MLHFSTEQIDTIVDQIVEMKDKVNGMSGDHERKERDREGKGQLRGREVGHSRGEGEWSVL